jgi:hypothetical protein
MLQRMRDERRPLRRPWWLHDVVRGAGFRWRCALGPSAAHARDAGPLRSHTTPTHAGTMALPATTLAEDANWAVDLPSEVWALVAKERGVVGACQMMRVCNATRAGGKEFLSSLPGLVVCGGRSSGGEVSDAMRLDLATMRWVPMPALVTARDSHACCAVRGNFVVLGGMTTGNESTSSVEMLSSEEGGAFVELPPLPCSAMWGALAIAVEKSDSAVGQVILLGGMVHAVALSSVQLVDLATGECAPQNNLLHPLHYVAAGRLPDGRIVCTGGYGGQSSVGVWGPPAQEAADVAWTWTELPAMSVGRYASCGCVMSDGRFAVLGGVTISGVPTTSCEALVVDGDAHWEPMSPMHDAREHFACGAVARCVFVAGGRGLRSTEVYDEELNRWLRLPCDLPDESGTVYMGSAVL